MLNDVRQAFRSLRKAPGFTAVAVVTLALGIGANTAIFSVINSVLLRPLPYADPDRLVELFTRGREQDSRFSLSYPDAQELREVTRAFAALAPYTTQSYNLTGGTEPREIRAALVGPDLFRVLGASAEAGRTFAPTELREQVALLSHALWAAEFGADRSVIGQPLMLDGRPFTVVGVMPRGFRFPDDETRLWVPLGQAFVANPQTEHSRDMYLFNTVARLAPGITVEQAAADAAVVARRINAAQRDGGEQRLEIRIGGRGAGGPPQASMIPETQFLVEPLLAEVLRSGVSPRALWILFGAVGLVLLIACANVAALLLARSTSRRREVAIRQAIGAGRWRIVRQLLTESVVLAAIGGGAGTVLAYWTVDGLVALWPDVLPRAHEIGMDARVLAFTVGLSVLTGLAFGLIPALRAAAPDVERMLREESGASTGARARQRINRGLVMAELAVSLVLLVGSGLLIRSFIRLTSVELGYDTREVLAARVRLTPARYAGREAQLSFFQRLTEQLAGHPAVAHASLSRTLPLTGGVQILAFDPRDVRPDYPEPFLASRLSVISPGYLATVGIPLRGGRDFSAADREGGPMVAVINSRLGDILWPGQDPVGRSIPMAFPGLGPTRVTVVGVIGDVRYASLDAPVMPEVYLPHTQARSLPQAWVTIRARGSPLALSGALRDAVRQLDADQPVAELVSLDQMISRSTATRRFNLTLLSVFAGLAVALALVGIYGVTAYAVTQRIRELGLRMAVGASPRDLIGMLLSESLLLVLVGVGAGLAGAVAATRVLGSLLFETSPYDVAAFATASTLLAVVALMATYVPARRAARVDPMLALRSEP
ncbi:MAG TPA: ABC transporter permease [Gemmatimonadales bacterium]|nr:ABC transporter permease [Gemmatimonadales bacterium]